MTYPLNHTKPHETSSSIRVASCGLVDDFCSLFLSYIKLMLINESALIAVQAHRYHHRLLLVLLLRGEDGRGRA